jgi:hypothetical protein
MARDRPRAARSRLVKPSQAAFFRGSRPIGRSRSGAHAGTQWTASRTTRLHAAGMTRRASESATSRSVAIGVAHLSPALTHVHPDEFGAAVDLVPSRMASRTDGELASVPAAVDQSNSVIVVIADARRRTATDEATR